MDAHSAPPLTPIFPTPRIAAAPPWTVDHWAAAHQLWLDSRRSPTTRRAYRKATELLFSFTRKPPADIGKADIAAWIASQLAAGLTPETVHQRLAAVSSFYTFVTRVYTLPDASGRETPLHAYNPAAAIPRPRVSPYGKSIYLSSDQAHALLRAIPLTTAQGLRDYALILTYLLTGRRNTEIRALCWGDIETAGSASIQPPPIQARSSGRVLYRWSGKGKSRRDELPLPAYHAILAYLSAAGRLPHMQPNDPIFVALNANAARLHPGVEFSSAELPRGKGFPLSARMVGRLVKRYARRAGLDPARITVHTLRHTAVMLRKQTGDSLENISTFLNHANIAVTQIYLHRLDASPDASWQKVEALLGLPSLSAVSLRRPASDVEGPLTPAPADSPLTASFPPSPKSQDARPRLRRRLRPSVR